MSKNMSIIFRAAFYSGALCTLCVVTGCDGEVVGPVALESEAGTDVEEAADATPSDSPERSEAEEPAAPAVETTADGTPATTDATDTISISPDRKVTAAKPVADEEPSPAAAPDLAAPAGGGFTPLDSPQPGGAGELEKPAAGIGFNPAAAKPPALGGSFSPLEPAAGSTLPGPAGAGEEIKPGATGGGFSPASGPDFNPAGGIQPAAGGGFAPAKQPNPAPAISPADAGGFAPAGAGGLAPEKEPVTPKSFAPATPDPAAAPLPAPADPRTPAAGGIESPAPITPRASGAGEPGVLPVPAPPSAPATTGDPSAGSDAKQDFEVRDWKDASGIYTIRGKFHAHLEEKGRVRILRPSGNTVTIGINQLSDRDMGYVKALTNPAAQDSLRTWTDRSGTHKMQAKLLEVLPGKVRLQNDAGQNFSIGVADLSDQDQGFVEAINE